MDPTNGTSLIAFFDLETTPPPWTIVEFGAILVSPKTLEEKYSYSKLVRIPDLSRITPGFESKGITRDDVANASPFVDIAREVFDLLHGRIWGGHNSGEFDIPRLKEAFEEIRWSPPEPKGTVDTLILLDTPFGNRAGDMKLESLATYFELDKQTHRALDDARLSLEVFKKCGALLFLESTCPQVVENDIFYHPENVHPPSINVSLTPFYCGSPKIQIFYKDARLKLCCSHMNVRYEPRRNTPLNFVVDAPANLCELLDCCDRQAYGLFECSGSTSKWNQVVTVYSGRETVRLRIRKNRTKLCLKWGNRPEQQFQVRNEEKLNGLFDAGTTIDAFFLVDTYDYMQEAGIGLFVEKLIVYCD